MTTDAIFFLKDGKVIKEMMMSEFDAILDDRTLKFISKPVLMPVNFIHASSWAS